jgi:hypothetical protein
MPQHTSQRIPVFPCSQLQRHPLALFYYFPYVARVPALMHEAIVANAGMLHHCTVIFPERRGWLDCVVGGTY